MPTVCDRQGVGVIQHSRCGCRGVGCKKVAKDVEYNKNCEKVITLHSFATRYFAHLYAVSDRQHYDVAKM